MRKAPYTRSVLFAAMLSMALILLSQTMFAGSRTAQVAARNTSRTVSTIPDRVTQAVDESSLVKLSRNTRPEMNALNDRGALADDFNIDHVLLVLKRSPEQ